MVVSGTTDADREPFAEVDPTGRYGRYAELLGCGAVKKVYRAFDQEEGIEVAWNQVKLGKLTHHHSGPDDLTRVYNEVKLLKKFRSDHIIALYHVWKDEERNVLNFITEAFTSGDLRKYTRKHRHVSLKALKKWCWQILKGLEYLHTNELCVIHRDLNCSNVFINGNTGLVKIGDFGLAAAVGNTKNHEAHSMLGTPEFMAPEVYAESYNELVDVYSFGMCVLELVTVEVPYSECVNPAQVYRKVVSGIRPQGLDKVRDAGVRGFIDKCLAEAGVRPSASDLLKDPFFEGVEEQVTEGIQMARC
uniref:non-specific serine/threonine protein kinase n=1 Tax=Kalanchoe fedtschenkoi TaxID=63787 RepID=A0A7N0RC40_KALFE